MINGKTIVIGCDSTADLSVMLHSIKETVSFSPNIISVSRVADLVNILRSLDPDVIMLCFRNNQAVLSDLHSYVRKPGIPVLCLLRPMEQEPMSWHSDHIVFTCSLQHINNPGYLISRLNSILRLRTETANPPPVHGYTPIRQQEAAPVSTQNLSKYVMELDQKTGVLAKIKERIAELYPRVDDTIRASLTSIVNAIKMSANDQNLWDDFKLYFEMTDPGFLLLLAQKHPELTSKDLKYCCYLKMNMSNDDIRSLLGINQESVRTHKYRLKKKMLLSKDEDLLGYLRSVSSN